MLILYLVSLTTVQAAETVDATLFNIPVGVSLQRPT